jgi:hypothetical protein
MGLDADIYFATDAPRLRIPHWMNLTVVKLDEACRDAIPEGATHKVDIGDRYWCPIYRRGSWPFLCSILMNLLGSPDVTEVWYGNDEGCRPFTKDTLIEYVQEFVTNRREPYCGWDEITLEDEDSQ